MKNFFLFLIHICFLFFISYGIASPYKKFKLAVFDNPQPDPSRTESAQEFVNSYLSGINTAIAVAATKGIFITEKEFFHGNNLADIIQQASSTKSWKPDVIMGFNTSNDFLMSKAFFGDQLVLSISATDAELTSLPKGFYSLGIPDTNAVNIIIKFINEHYQNANLFIMVAAESKESVDFADLLAKIYKDRYPAKKITEHKFLTDDISHIVLTKLMDGYQKGDVIVLMSIGYDSAVDLMNKVSGYLSPNRPVFVTSTDNWGNNATPKNINGNYDAFRIDTLSGGEETNNYKIFAENFKKIYRTPPTDKISFVTYQTVMSCVDALVKYPSPQGLSAKDALWSSYQKALKHYPNWYRPPQYIVYKLEYQKEVYFETLT